MLESGLFVHASSEKSFVPSALCGLAPKGQSDPKDTPEGMRKGNVPAKRGHVVPAKGRNRTAQIENLGRATLCLAGPWAKPKTTRRREA